MTRSRASRRSRRRHRICLPNPARTRPSVAIMNTSAAARSASLAGIDLLTGAVHALVKDRHRSREFIEFLKLLDAAYPAHTAIKLILDL